MCEEIAQSIHTEIREYNFKGIYNFRDMGGYAAKDRKIVAWNRLFRSGELRFMTKRDLSRIKQEIRPRTVIDLRDAKHAKENGNGRLDELGVRYFNIPLTNETENRKTQEEQHNFTGIKEEIYYHIEKEETGKRILEVLTLMADINNYPLIFHCNAGKKRTGIMAMIILGVLGVSDEDIIDDYLLSAKYIGEIRERLSRDPGMAEEIGNMPEYNWRVEPEDVMVPLMKIREKYGSVRDFMKTHGADERLFSQLENNLLTRPPGPSGSAE